MVELASKYSTYRLSQVHSDLTPNRLPRIGKMAKFQTSILVGERASSVAQLLRKHIKCHRKF